MAASRARGLDWHGAQAPSLAEFEAIADRAFQRLPRRFRDLCKDVVIRIEDFPTDEVLDALAAESEFDLLGLYHGVDLARQSVMDPAAMPEMVFLYRRPILDYWAEHEETLGHIVTHVLVHEIGHHFGLSDADMHHIEEEAAA
ncbi:metallopeptidase family protein [Methyloceanibacter sp.]|uniref:metallopeptidase family protein n=1 Tax=Methyloceanibacter sp. TaxID=1965321 RepID=UPI003D6D6129